MCWNASLMRFIVPKNEARFALAPMQGPERHASYSSPRKICGIAGPFEHRKNPQTKAQLQCVRDEVE